MAPVRLTSTGLARCRLRTGSRLAGLFAAAAAIVAAQPAFGHRGAPPLQPLRRSAALALGLPALLTPVTGALAGDRDRDSMVLAIRRRKMPILLQTYKELKAAGSITDEFLSKDLKKFVGALEAYGSINRMAEAPDKFSKKLLQDAKEFKEFAKQKDYAQAMSMLETYRSDVPTGSGQFTWDSTLASDLGENA